MNYLSRKHLIFTQISRISRRALATLVLAIRFVNTRQSRQLRAFSDAAICEIREISVR